SPFLITSLSELLRLGNHHLKLLKLGDAGLARLKRTGDVFAHGAVEDLIEKAPRERSKDPLATDLGTVDVRLSGRLVVDEPLLFHRLEQAKRRGIGELAFAGLELLVDLAPSRTTATPEHFEGL